MEARTVYIHERGNRTAHTHVLLRRRYVVVGGARRARRALLGVRRVALVVLHLGQQVGDHVADSCGSVHPRGNRLAGGSLAELIRQVITISTS